MFDVVHWHGWRGVCASDEQGPLGLIAHLHVHVRQVAECEAPVVLVGNTMPFLEILEIATNVLVVYHINKRPDVLVPRKHVHYCHPHVFTLSVAEGIDHTRTLRKTPHRIVVQQVSVDWHERLDV